MKNPDKKWILLLPLLAAWISAQAQPGWSLDPAPYQFDMTAVAQIKIAGVPNHQMNNYLAAFSHGQIRGYATPVSFSGQAYYFLSLFSNQYQDDTLYFRAYIGTDQKVYESVDSVVFRHHLALGSIGAPFQVRLELGDKPLIYSSPEVDYLANTCADVLDVQATDKQNSEGNGLTYSIAGGADAARFAINPQTGLLSWFNFSPAFAPPQDDNGDNRYELDVNVTDTSSLFDLQHITVRVVNVLPALPALVCPANLSLTSSSDGMGNCGAGAAQTAVPLPNPCAASLMTYDISGATTAAGTGLVPPGQVFAVGASTVHYARSGGGECSFTVMVTDNEPPTVTCPPNQTVVPAISSPCSAVVSGINAVFNDNCSGATLAYTRSGATSGNGSGQAGGQTFLAGATTVTYTATDGAGLGSSCSFTVTVISCNIVFSGAIKWEHDGTSGVQTATVSLTGAGTGSAVTNGSGDYQISIPYATGNFTLKPTKNINKTNGVTSADVTAIQQHVGNTALLPAPFKRIAADVNKSNSITSIDASLVSQVLQGSPQANAIFNTSWRFVPAAYTFPNPNVPWGFPEQINLTGVNSNVSGQDFKGIKLGDVATTWANPANFGAGEPLVFRVQDGTLQAGSELTAEFRADQLDDLNSFQFALHFDPEQLQLLEIVPLNGLPVSMDNFGTYNVAEGEIRVVWSQATSLMLNDAAPVFRLRFQALESGARLSEVLQLTGPGDSALPGYVYNSKYAESGVELRYTASTGTEPVLSGPALALDNQPNPFVEVTTLRFMLPEAGEAQLRISDAAGRLVFSQKKTCTAGWQQETLRLEGVSGVLFAELVTERGSVVRKMLAQIN